MKRPEESLPTWRSETLTTWRFLLMPCSGIRRGYTVFSPWSSSSASSREEGGGDRQLWTLKVCWNHAPFFIKLSLNEHPLFIYIWELHLFSFSFFFLSFLFLFFLTEIRSVSTSTACPWVLSLLPLAQLPIWPSTSSLIYYRCYQSMMSFLASVYRGSGVRLSNGERGRCQGHAMDMCSLTASSAFAAAMQHLIAYYYRWNAACYSALVPWINFQRCAN